MDTSHPPSGDASASRPRVVPFIQPMSTLATELARSLQAQALAAAGDLFGACERGALDEIRAAWDRLLHIFNVQVSPIKASITLPEGVGVFDAIQVAVSAALRNCEAPDARRFWYAADLVISSASAPANTPAPSTTTIRRVYIAAPYPLRATAIVIKGQFEAAGLQVTSRWLDAPEINSDEHAQMDLDDVAAADLLFALNPFGWENAGTGGRHVELGYAVRADKPVVLAGVRSNIFHHLRRLTVIESVDAAVAHVLALAAPLFDFLAHLERQRRFSEATFGPVGTRIPGVIDHLRRELVEVEQAPHDLGEWIDVVILGLDGAWRAGHSARDIIAALVAKQTRNEGRTWPDWRTQPDEIGIQHLAEPGPVAEGR